MVAKHAMTDTSLDGLRALIAGDEALQARLAEFTYAEDFAAAATEAAALSGIAVDPAAIVAECFADPIGMEQYNEAPPNTTDWPGRAWLPSAVSGSPAGLVVRWQHFGDRRLTESFYQDSLHHSRARKLNTFFKIRTPLATLLDQPPADADPTAPAALIFHMSRCGSTLVSRMIAALTGTAMLSEPPPLDAMVQLLHTHPQVPIEERVGLLRGMAAALGRDRFGDRRRYVIKADSWHTLSLPLFRAAFPDTPWVFLFRDPVEVMVSQMRARGLQTVPGGTVEGLYGMSNAEAVALPVEDYIAHVLATVNKAAIEHAALGGGIFVDYADLPGAVEDRILPHFGITPDAAEVEAMRGQTRLDAKSPSLTFANDKTAKRDEASDAVRAAVTEYLDPVHRELRALAAR